MSHARPAWMWTPAADPLPDGLPEAGGELLRSDERAPFASHFGHDFGRISVHGRSQTEAPSGMLMREETPSSGPSSAPTSAPSSSSASGPSSAPALPESEFVDCPAEWQTKIKEAIPTAQEWVAKSITQLSSISGSAETSIHHYLDSHFHTTEPDHITKIIKKYEIISAALRTPLTFECEKRCRTARAYVYSIFWTNIHLCPAWYEGSTNGQARTIIHELAHSAAGCGDKAYQYQTRRYGKLRPRAAMNNADSYARFAEATGTLAPMFDPTLHKEAETKEGASP